MGAAKKKPLEQRLLELLGSQRYQPLNKTELAKRLQIPSNERSKFGRLLNELETVGKITKIRKDRYVLPKEADLMVGVLQVNPDGFGYLLNESGDGQGDLYISAENQGTAMQKDRVVARIIRDRVLPERRGRNRASREGRVIKVLVRANQTIVGTLQRSKKFYYVVPDEPALVHDIYVTAQPGQRMPEVNDKVVVRLEPWEHRHLNPEGDIIEVLGPAQKPGVDILSIIRKYDLPVAFPDAVLKEADQIPLEIPERELHGREDLRSTPVFTIDPDNARDFDDAIHVMDADSGWSIGIHIADVSHYVKPGSALDREALRRGNSVYFPDRVLPMLPERLSNQVCSLRPNEDHLTKSVFVEFDRAGRIKSHRFAATVIRSVARLTYREAFAVLQRKPATPLQSDLHRAWRLATILRERRFRHGALELDMPEVRVVLDGEGKAVGLEREENDISHQLIEELMLLANELVATQTKEGSVPSIYRIHEEPDAERLAEYRAQIQSYGIAVGDLSQRREMQRFLKLVVGRPEEAALKIGLLRSLRKAAYSPDPLGHFGLAKTNYTHFTSPIRRYADLLVHRSFASMLPRRRGNPLRSMDLATTCEHISMTERIAAEAEREAVRLKKLEFFAGLVRKPLRLEGTILDVRNYGLLVELKEALVVGMIRISSLDHDFFVFDPARQRITGRRSKMSFGVGDRVTVRVARVDAFRQRIDFDLVAKE
ncbi:MAG: ribonuclease R [Verrucomicrobia bacterium]|nr:ribonuclease R [Verrucomicrobiota bacterium]